MTKRVSSLFLAIVMLLQMVVPQTAIAKEGAKAPSDNLVKVGMINGNSYDSKLMLELNRQTAKNRKKRAADPGIRLFGYFEEDQEPKDADKLKYHGEVKAKLTVKGLDGNPFQWKEVFGKEEVHLRFIQMNDDTGVETGVVGVLNVNKAGEYTWTDGEGNPAELPLFNNNLEPLTYEVKLDEEVSDRVKLLTARLTTTEDASPTFDRPDADGRIKYHLTLEIGLQQVASSKFVSEWHTAVGETERPQLQGTMTGSMDTGKSKTININLPTNDNDNVIVRTASRRDKNKFLPEFLYKTPTTDIKTDTAGLTFKDNNGVKTVEKDGHKYKYDFKYDVINGGKLTMTEVIPVTFDANGGKFASITEPNAEQKIKKEVDYDGTLTDKAKDPKKDRETFKGWSTTEDGKNPITDKDLKNITKAKTFYAIWENNKITADELTVHESYKNGTDYVNDFIPKLADLKAQVKIKGANGDPQALENTDKIEVLKADGQTAFTQDEIDNGTLKDYLYEKLKEKDDGNKPNRVETVKAKVTVNGRSKIVDIPIKVIKNIYEAKTLTENPYYVPDNYVKVTLDPTTKATAPQKTYYYVNPAAKVVIPGKDPVGTGDNKFIKWTMKADDAAADVKGEDYKLTDRHQFKKASTITAQYSADVVPQKGANKPEGVPDNFVKVTFVPTENGTMEGAKTFWVNPTVEVKIPVKNPVGKTYYTFKEWKMGVNADGDAYNPGTAKKFEQDTTITATYVESKTIIPFDPKSPDPKKTPEGYVKITFKAEEGLELTASKGYYVKKNAVDSNNVALTLKTIKDDATNYGYPKVTEQTGYTFEKWDPEDTTTIGENDIVVTAKAKTVDDVVEKKDDVDQPKGYVEVTFIPTDMATDKTEKTFWVNPTKEVTIPMAKPVGKTVKAGGSNPQEYAWVFKNWTSDETPSRTWSKNIDTGVTSKFPVNTKITANYDKNTVDNGKVEVKEIIAYESTKDVNDFIPTAEALKAQVKVKDASGNEGNLPAGASVELVDDGGNAYTDDALKTALYGKLQEKDNPNGEPTRVEKVKAKVTFKNGEVQTVDIPIKVYKNIYESKTLGLKPIYVPNDYVKVTLDPTKKATDSQKTFYYVNPKAKVVIPGTDPTGTGDNKFVKWTSLVDGSAAGTKPSDFDLAKRHQFEKATTITAQYVSDVIPAKNDGSKAEGTPDNFVKVTFVPTDKATDTTQKIFYVNPEKEVTIPMTDPKGATYYTFKEWKIGDVKTGETYKVGTAKQFTDKNGTTITATYTEAENIIPYNPDEPTTRPVGYVRVTFEAEEGLTLSNVQAYYVKKGANITLGDTKIIKPTTAAKTGYEFNKWDKDDALVLGDADVVVKALAKTLPDTKEKKDGEEKPAAYVEVKFVAGENGQLTENNANITEKVYYVNPNKYVTITPPTAVGNTGYEFGSWDKDPKIPTQYKNQLTTITASFNQLKDVVPKTKDDETEKPAGYKTVTFVIEGEGGSIVNGQTTVFYVDPGREVTLQAPQTNAETGYKFKEWDKNTATPTKYTEDTKVKGSFKKLKDIIPAEENGTTNAKPDGYITVTFDKGEHGTKIEGQTVYYVNPTAGKKLSDITTKPTVTPETGWKVNGWDKEETTELKGPGDVLVKAQYKAYDDVIPKTTNDESEKPEGYFTVTFKSTDKGSIGSTVDGTKVVYVNPNKAVVLKDKAPDVTGIPGYQFGGWDLSIDQAIQYKDNTVITAQYNKSEDISKVEVPGYVKVEFKSETNGTLSGTTEYWIKPGVEVTIPAPPVKPNVGYAFKEWDNSLTVTRQAGADTYTITATYTEEQPVIPKTKTDDSEKPNGYVTVTFDKGDHGALSGQTIYFVNPNKKVTLTAPTVTADLGFKQKADGAAWNHALEGTFANDTKITAQYESIAEVVPETNDGGTKNEQPKGYVTVKLIPTDKATAQTKAEKIYFVNPTKKVTITNTPVGTKVTDANNITYEYTFKGWTVTKGTIGSWDGGNIAGTFIQDTEITAQYSTKVDWKDVVATAKPKDNAVTSIGDKPNPADLIGNPFDKNDSDNKNNLPKDSKISYAENGEPSVDRDGKVTAKVKIEYPGGKTTVVEVPVTVVKTVVPQFGGESGTKPLVPENYVKVIVDTTDKAVDNTKFRKVFWVKPNEQVTIPNILDPTGKSVEEGGVTKTYKFVKWILEGSNPEKTYDHGADIKGTFTAQESKIVADYEQGKNVDPEPNSGQWIPKGSEPSPKDFIKNPYNDDDPNNPSNLPSGTKIEFDGSKPDTSTEAKDKSVTIKITYPNGEVRKVPITYNVTGDVVEQKDPNTKPAVPDEFVKVIVDKTENAQLAAGENQTQVFWVNPTKTVTIPVNNPTANKEDMVFTEWDKSLTQKFTEETTITAKFSKKQTPIEPLPTAGYVITERGVQPKSEDYKKVITPPAGKTIKSVAVVTPPNVDKGGMTTAKVSVTYEDNTTVQIPVQVFVQNKEQPIPTPQPDPIPQPYPTPQPYPVPYPVPGETKTVYKDRTVLRREVRYMQGFEGKFRPDDGLTRAEAAQILANALKEDGYPFDLRYKLPYKDTTKEMWYNDAVRITTQADVFIGYDDGEFKPQRKITRAEWIATLRRFQYVDKVGGNSLHMRKNHWAIPEVEAAYRSGWLSIYTEKKAPFNYDEPISRKEVAAVSNRAFRRVRDMAYIRRNDKFMINYTDINRDMWAYDDILCASNTFLHQRQGAYIAYKRGDKAYTIDVKDAIIEQDLFQRIPRHR